MFDLDDMYSKAGIITDSVLVGGPDLGALGTYYILLEYMKESESTWTQVINGVDASYSPRTAIEIQTSDLLILEPFRLRLSVSRSPLTQATIYLAQAQVVSDFYNTVSLPFPGPQPSVTNVSASQRNDSSRLVDIYYDLEYPSGADANDLYPYYVYASAKIGSGEEDLQPCKGVLGDVGANQLVDTRKHIVWNPSIDFPDDNATDCTVDVNVISSTELNETTISYQKAGKGVLEGTVRDEQGKLVEAIIVDLARDGGIILTDSDSHYRHECNAGERIIAVIPKSDTVFYSNLIHVYTVREDSHTSGNFVLGTKAASTTEPQIINVQSIFCNTPANKYAHFVSGIDFPVSFEVEIDWGTANDVDTTNNELHWISVPPDVTPVPGDTFLIQPCSQTRTSQTFNMGNLPEGRLGVKAVDPDGASSAIEYVNCEIIPMPDILEIIPESFYIPMATDEGFEYRLEPLDKLTSLFDELTPASDILVFGQKLMKAGMAVQKAKTMYDELNTPPTEEEDDEDQEEEEDEDKPDHGEFSASFSGLITSDGIASVGSIGWDKEIKKETHRHNTDSKKWSNCDKAFAVASTEIKPSVSFEYDYLWEQQNWNPRGTVGVNCEFSYKTPNYIVAYVYGVPVYFRAELALLLGTELIITQLSSSNNWEYVATIILEPQGTGTLGAGMPGAVCIEGYLGGGFHTEIVLWPPLWDSDETYIILTGGVRAVLGPFVIEKSYTRHWENPTTPGAEPAFGSFTVSDDVIVLERVYPSSGGYVDTIPIVGGHSSYLVDPESTDPSYPYSDPMLVQLKGLAPTSNDLLAVWLRDDTSRGDLDRSELVYSRRNSNDATFEYDSWDPNLPLFTGPDDDNTNDMNPELIALSGGKAACIWQNTNVSSLPFGTEPTDFLNKQDITISIYDNSSGSWSSPHTFDEDNDYLDRSPKLTVIDNLNKIVAVWIRNENDDHDYYGTATAKNKIMYSEGTDPNDSGSWKTPFIVAADLDPILDTTFACDQEDDESLFIFSSPEAPTDPIKMLYSVKYDGSSSSWVNFGAITKTDDGIDDSAPRLVYNPVESKLHLFWVRGDEIMWANGTTPDNLISNIEDDLAVSRIRRKATMGLRDFDVIVEENSGAMALLWSDPSKPIKYEQDPNFINPGYDIFVCYYEPLTQMWSQPCKLTHDDAVERFVTGLFPLVTGSPPLVGNRMIGLYDRVQTVYETRTLNVCNPSGSDPSYIDEDCGGDPIDSTIEVQHIPTRGRSDLFSMNYTFGVDLAMSNSDIRIVPSGAERQKDRSNTYPFNPLTETEVDISARIRNYGEFPAIDYEVTCKFMDVYEIIDDVCKIDPNISTHNHEISVSIFDSTNPGHPDNKFSYNLNEVMIPGGDSIVLTLDDYAMPLVFTRETLPGITKTAYNDVRLKERVLTFDVTTPGSDPKNDDRDESNNSGSHAVAQPDLTIPSVVAKQFMNRSRLLSVRVANEGASDVTSTNVLIREKDTVPPQDDFQDEKTITDIRAGAFYDVDFTIGANVDISLIECIVDSNNDIDEYNEENNLTEVAFPEDVGNPCSDPNFPDPPDFEVQTPDYSSITMQVGAVVNAAYYRFEEIRGLGPSSDWQLGTSFVAENLRQCSEYKYIATVIDNAGKQSSSDTLTITTTGKGCEKGNINCSGTIDIVDLVIMAEAWIDDWTTRDDGTIHRADINCDKVIDLYDFVILSELWVPEEI